MASYGYSSPPLRGQPAALVEPSTELGHPCPLQLNLLFLEWRGWTPSPPNMKASRRIWEVQAAAPREHHISGPGLQGAVKDLRRAVVGSPPPDTAHDETPQPGTCQHWRCAAFGSSEVFGERSCPPSSSHPACSRSWPHIPSPPFHLPAQQLSLVPVFLAALGQRQS